MPENKSRGGLCVIMEELAHYGRWFPDEGHPSPLWWFDARRGEMLPVEAACRACGCERAEDLDVEACKAVDIIPCFQVDIPSLERKYARVYIFEPQRTALLRLDGRALDREFRRVIEANALRGTGTPTNCARSRKRRNAGNGKTE